ncbi:DUF397 domain-containing protein [Streptomyces boncukensis]|uniref:DUF397 domain-containing protein n=1 Tax=Streptomyces boncukensis TaxID=2711219 RepID=A0A6G4X584_9ACTN|nr:DUF397 domain-containing protein [Streptomyces boncukensis]
MHTPIRWQKSSSSGGDDGNDCVEVAAIPASLLLRESDDPDVVLTPQARAVADLLAHLKRSGQ